MVKAMIYSFAFLIAVVIGLIGGYIPYRLAPYNKKLRKPYLTGPLLVPEDLADELAFRAGGKDSFFFLPGGKNTFLFAHASYVERRDS